MIKFNWREYPEANKHRVALVLRDNDDHLIGYLYSVHNPLSDVYWAFNHYGNEHHRIVLITGSDLENAKRETERDILQFMDRCLLMDIENLKIDIEKLRGKRAKIGVQIDAMDSSQAR